MTFTAGGFDTDIYSKVVSTGIFGDKVFKVYDPKLLKDLKRKVNPPVCGIVYEGIISDGDDGDIGASTNLYVSLIVIADQQIRDARQTVDKNNIASILDMTRRAILGTMSPSTKFWEFVVEVPFELDSEDMAYYQKWKTKVSIC